MAAIDGGPRKVRRISRACDYCHHRSIRCRVSDEGDGTRCQNCVDFDQACTYNRPAKRRGVKPRQRSSSATSSPHDDQSRRPRPESVSYHPGSNGHLTTSQTSPTTYISPVLSKTTSLDHWRAPYIASQALIMGLVEVYFEVIYPV